jgi:hypothetical protein
MMPQETHPDETDSKDKSRNQVHKVECTGDTLVVRVDGRLSDIRGVKVLGSLFWGQFNIRS